MRKGTLNGVSLDDSIEPLIVRDPIVGSEDLTKFEMIRMMQSQSIRHLPIVDDTRRVLRLIKLEELLSSPTAGMKAVIMAGGKGTRLRP